MKLRVTNGQAFGMLSALESASSETGMLGFAIAKNRRIIRNELSEYINKRNEIIQKYTILNEDGSMDMPNDNVRKANEELDPYSAVDCEVCVMQVSQDIICGGGLTAEQMYNLDFMVEDGGEE